MQDNSLLTINEVARELGVHPCTLRTWDHNGTLKAQRTAGGHRRWRVEDVEQHRRQHQRVVVIHSERQLTTAERDGIKELVLDQLPQHKVILLTPGLSLAYIGAV